MWWPKVVRKYHLSPWAAGLLKSRSSVAGRFDASEVVPRYNYWPLGHVSQPLNITARFFRWRKLRQLRRPRPDCANQGFNRIVAFVNSETPLGMSPGSQVVVDTADFPLFGSYYPDSGPPYGLHGWDESPATLELRFEVFSNANNQLDALCQGLYNASWQAQSRLEPRYLHRSLHGRHQEYGGQPRKNTAAGREVTVWVYNNRG